MNQILILYPLLSKHSLINIGNAKEKDLAAKMRFSHRFDIMNGGAPEGLVLLSSYLCS